MSFTDLADIYDGIGFGNGPFDDTTILIPVAPRNGGTLSSGHSARWSTSEAGSGQITVPNPDGHLTPGSNASPYYPVTDGFPFRRSIRYPKGPGGTWYALWAGYVTDIAAAPEGVLSSAAQISVSQRLALPAGNTMGAYLAAVMLATNPDMMWPLTDDAGSSQASDIAPVRADWTIPGPFPLSPVQSGIGGALDFGAGQAAGPDEAAAAAFTSATYYDGVRLQRDVWFTRSGAPAPFSLLGGDFSLAAFVTGAAGTGQFQEIINTAAYFSDFLFTPVIYRASLRISAAGLLQAHVTDSGGVVHVADGPPVTADLTHVALTVHDAGLTQECCFYVNAELAGTFTCGSLWADTVAIGGWTGPTGLLSSCQVSYAAHWPAVLTAGQVADIAAAGLGTPETADLRFARLGGFAGITDSWMDTAGVFTTLIPPQKTKDLGLMDVWRKLEQAEGGRIVCAGDGRLVLQSRSASYGAAPVLTLSALTDFDVDDAFGVDSDGLINSLTGTRPGGTEQTSEDPDSIARRGKQSPGTWTLALTTDDAVADIINWNVGLRAWPGIRVPGVRLSGSKMHTNGKLAAVLALAEGDKVTLTDLPAWCPASSMTLAADRLEWAFSSDLTITLTLAPDVPLLTFDDAVLGRFAEDPGSITLDHDLNETDLAAAVAIAGTSPRFTTAAGDLPFDIEIDGERITVSAVAGGSASWRIDDHVLIDAHLIIDATGADTQDLTFASRAVAPTWPRDHALGAEVSVYGTGVLAL